MFSGLYRVDSGSAVRAQNREEFLILWAGADSGCSLPRGEASGLTGGDMGNSAVT
ncbi:MAG: hypothetical protein WCC63_05675 [Candidatus Bathyarchaeia archaeon]